MTITVGQTLPDGEFQTMTPEGPSAKTVAELFGGHKVALFAVPGAFTPTCSARHLPGFRDHAAALHAKGVTRIVGLSVNDVFVMGAWAKDQNVGEHILLVADGGGVFTKAIGLDMDTGAFGGLRSKRYSMLVDNRVVKILNVEAGGAFEVSSAEHLLSQL